MTEYSYNGWSASTSLPTRPLVVAGEPFMPGVRDNDDVFTVLQYVAVQLHARVEPIVAAGWHQADDWGYSYRPNRNDPNSLSNHSSGTAFDYNATRHPNGVPTRNTWSSAQIDVVHTILAEVAHAVRWGGDYTGTPDSMHFEINVNAATLAGVAARVREGDDPMADYATQLDRIESKVDAAAAASKARDQGIRAADRKLAKATRDLLAAMGDDVAGLNEKVVEARKRVLAAIAEADASSGDGD